MNGVNIIILGLIVYTIGISSTGVYYTVITNKLSVSEVITRINTNSIIKCAVQCSEIQGCDRANFKNNESCELLYGRQGDEIADDQNTKLIRTYLFY